ncbi:UNVERIFIED_CONTAM: hypothetical protein HDU68_003711, partial [Siphonaria sp. JEL0065]
MVHNTPTAAPIQALFVVKENFSSNAMAVHVQPFQGLMKSVATSKPDAIIQLYNKHLKHMEIKVYFAKGRCVSILAVKGEGYYLVDIASDSIGWDKKNNEYTLVKESGQLV